MKPAHHVEFRKLTMITRKEGPKDAQHSRSGVSTKIASPTPPPPNENSTDFGFSVIILYYSVYFGSTPPPSISGKIHVILVTIASWVGRSNASLPGRNWRGSGWPLCCCSQDLHRLKVMTGDDIFGTANLSKPQQIDMCIYIYIYTYHIHIFCLAVT